MTRPARDSRAGRVGFRDVHETGEERVAAAVTRGGEPTTRRRRRTGGAALAQCASTEVTCNWSTP